MIVLGGYEEGSKNQVEIFNLLAPPGLERSFRFKDSRVVELHSYGDVINGQIYFNGGPSLPIGNDAHGFFDGFLNSFDAIGLGLPRSHLRYDFHLLLLPRCL